MRRILMKKLVSCILLIAILFSFCACGGHTSKPDESRDTQQEQLTDKETTYGNDDESAEKTWKLNYYVDDFQQPTDESYLCSKKFSGQFSNSATTNSVVDAEVLVDKENIAIFLYEYGYHQVKNSSSYYDDEYNITMRLKNGKEYKFSGAVYCGGDRIIINENYNSTIIKALSQKENSPVSFYIEHAKYATTKYLFSVTCDNFAEEYQKLSK